METTATLESGLRLALNTIGRGSNRPDFAAWAKAWLKDPASAPPKLPDDGSREYYLAGAAHALEAINAAVSLGSPSTAEHAEVWGRIFFHRLFDAAREPKSTGETR